MRDVSRETSHRLQAYEALLSRWNSKINLVSAGTLTEFRDRHLEDCAQILQHAETAANPWADLGSGGGLPGLVISILTQDRNTTVTLVESDQRKAAFLRTVIRELSLKNTSVRSDRIENLSPLNAANLSARALAPLPLLLHYAHMHLRPGGTAWFLKGRTWRDEYAAAQEKWQFQLEAFPSRTDPEAALLKITGVSNA